MECRVCGSISTKAFSNEILNKYQAGYYYCDNCGFLQTEKPHWLDEAYREAIDVTDAGYVTRNIYYSKKTFILFYLLFGKKVNYLDYAGGYGMFTRLLRDYGLNFYWEDKYAENLFARGLEYSGELIEAVTCFECFEHFVSPVEELEKILAISPNVLFSTNTFSNSIPPGKDWPYYGFSHGQHIAFYQKRTLEYLASKFGLNYYTDGEYLHMFTKKKILKNYLRLVKLLAKLQLDVFLRKII